MALPWKQLTVETYLFWTEIIINELSDELNDWESKFIESIYMRLQKGNNLSEAQANKLEAIYARTS